MGQKVHPIGFRIGVILGWNATWFAKKRQLPEFLAADLKLRKYIKAKFPDHGIVRVYIERKTEKSVRLTIYTAKPGILIGRAGTEVENLRKILEKIEGRQVFVNIKEVKDYATNAQLVAEGLAFQLEKRVSFRRAIKQSITRAMKMKTIKGIKVMVSGRLGGAEMSRREWARDGRIPLHTLRAEIDYGFAEAKTTFGVIGCKVWCFKGEIIPERQRNVAPVKPVLREQASTPAPVAAMAAPVAPPVPESPAPQA